MNVVNAEGHVSLPIGYLKQTACLCTSPAVVLPGLL